MKDYFTMRRWGVVASYEEDDRLVKTIVLFNGDREHGVYPVGFDIPLITVSQVNHVRALSGRGIDELFKRVSELEIYRNGAPLREGIPGRFSLPNFGKILRPTPHSA